jgi:hypothetical protein
MLSSVGAGFWVAQDGRTKADDRLGVANDRLADGRRQRLPVGHGLSPAGATVLHEVVEKGAKRKAKTAAGRTIAGKPRPGAQRRLLPKVFRTKTEPSKRSAQRCVLFQRRSTVQ